LVKKIFNESIVNQQVVSGTIAFLIAVIQYQTRTHGGFNTWAVLVVAAFAAIAYSVGHVLIDEHVMSAKKIILIIMAVALYGVIIATVVLAHSLLALGVFVFLFAWHIFTKIDSKNQMWAFLILVTLIGIAVAIFHK
jgi:hypothetical protein